MFSKVVFKQNANEGRIPAAIVCSFGKRHEYHVIIFVV